MRFSVMCQEKPWGRNDRSEMIWTPLFGRWKGHRPPSEAEAGNRQSQSMKYFPKKVWCSREIRVDQPEAQQSTTHAARETSVLTSVFLLRRYRNSVYVLSFKMIISDDLSSQSSQFWFKSREEKRWVGGGEKDEPKKRLNLILFKFL